MLLRPCCDSRPAGANCPRCPPRFVSTSDTTIRIVSLCCRTCPEVCDPAAGNSNPTARTGQAGQHGCSLTTRTVWARSLSAHLRIVMQKRRSDLDTSGRMARSFYAEGHPAQRGDRFSRRSLPTAQAQGFQQSQPGATESASCGIRRGKTEIDCRCIPS